MSLCFDQTGTYLAVAGSNIQLVLTLLGYWIWRCPLYPPSSSRPHHHRQHRRSVRSTRQSVPLQTVVPAADIHRYTHCCLVRLVTVGTWTCLNYFCAEASVLVSPMMNNVFTNTFLHIINSHMIISSCWCLWCDYLWLCPLTQTTQDWPLESGSGRTPLFWCRMEWIGASNTTDWNRTQSWQSRD